MRQILLIMVGFGMVLGCAQRTAIMVSSVWLNPVAKTKVGDAAAANLWAELQQCAATNADLPKSCKAGSKTVTIAKTPSAANCHWQCDETGLKKESCAWQVKAGAWNLEYRRVATITREQRKACGQNWDNTFNDPAQYEQNTCEAECFQLSDVVSLSNVDAPCAMELFGILAQRPRCVGPAPKGCRSKHNSPYDDPPTTPGESE
jgi:hypothetical protein